MKIKRGYLNTCANILDAFNNFNGYASYTKSNDWILNRIPRVLKVLEEHGEVSYRQAGPARIYYVQSNKGEI